MDNPFYYWTPPLPDRRDQKYLLAVAMAVCIMICKECKAKIEEYDGSQ